MANRVVRIESELFLCVGRFMTGRLFTPHQKKRQLISDGIKGPLVAAFGSPLMKALDRSVEMLGL